MKACNPNSPSPEATMMKFHDGNLITYGGTFCIQIPCGIDADCAFSPSTLLSFFRKERDQVSYSVSKGRLLVRHKRERVTIPCVDSDTMPIIDVHKPMKPTSFLKKKALKALIQCVDGVSEVGFLQGMCMRKGLAIATDNRIVLAMVSNLPKTLEGVLPIDTLKFLATLDEEIIGVAHDQSRVKFFFQSGMTVCSGLIDAASYPDIRQVINQEAEWVEMHKDLAEEVAGLKCDTLTVSHSGVGYRSTDGKSFGEIELKTEHEFAFSINKKYFDLLLSINIGTKIGITPSTIQANGKKFFKLSIAQTRMRS